MVSIRNFYWFWKYANFNWFNSVNEKDKTSLSEQVIPTILNNKTTITKNKHTHMYLEQEQQLEFLWILFDSPSLLNSSGTQNETSEEIQLDCQTGFYLIPLVVATKKPTKLYELFLAVIWYIFPSLGKETVMISIPKITCKIIIR